jgi:hypothetical protein
VAFVTFGPQTLEFTASGTWQCPLGVTSIAVQCWGGGGGGAASSSLACGGGGGGAFAAERALTVTPGKLYNFTVGQGGAGGLLVSLSTFPGSSGGTTTFPGDSVAVIAAGGQGSATNAGGNGGAAGADTVAWAGGTGGAGFSGTGAPKSGGGGGGGAAGIASAGNAGSAGQPSSTLSTSGDGGPGGAATGDGGAGGAGGTYNGAFNANGANGSGPGGGGGGCCGTGPGAGSSGGNGAGGLIVLTYVLPPVWTCPAGVFAVLAECWGGGGGGAFGTSGGGAGGGGEYASEPALAVTPLGTYSVTVGAGGNGAVSSGNGSAGTSTVFAGDSVTVTAHAGSGGASAGTGGAGGSGSSSHLHTSGGTGGAGHSGGGGGGGGGSGAPGSAGNTGGGATSGVGGTGAAAVFAGGPGGDGGTHTTSPGGLPPLSGPGGGGGGGYAGAGGNGFAGRVTLTWAIAALAGEGTLLASQFGPPGVVNQWAGTTAQNPVFGPSLPANASTVVPLDAGSSVGSGSGTATGGNWLFAVVGWHAAAGSPPVTVSVGDDLHSFWRPQAPSDATGGSRATVWYTPNLTGSPQYVYVAPSGYAAGFSVSVLEVSGLGTWDETTAVTAYAATSQELTLFAPAGVTELEYSAGVLSPVLHPISGTGGTAVPQLTFFLAAVCGDSTAAQMSFAPYGYTALETVTCANGSDSSGDTVLASACAVSASDQTVTATSVSAENLSGVIIAVIIDAPTPVPYGINPAWPYLIFEAAFGAGFQTPPDQMTWVNLQSVTAGHRCRSWSETTGVQYELDALQSSEVDLVLDNPDAYLSPFSPASPYYPHITPGTPVRLRAVPPGGTRWHVIQRNMERWPQQWENTFRGITNATGTDQWSVANRFVPTCYRAEVRADDPGWWYPCDDSGVNQATSLVNAAEASNNPLQIVISPNGLTSYGPNGAGGPGAVFAYIATQAFAQDAGWMYGDSDSASWQQAGNGVWNYGRHLSCQDGTFPPLSGGVTIEGWFNPAFANAGIPIPPNHAAAPVPQGYLGQPATTSGPTVTVGPIVLWTIASATAPLAQLSMDALSQLTFTTWSGSTPTSTVIYSLYPDQYLWDGAWMGITVTMTQSQWTVYVNGGAVATVSGTAGMAENWTYFLAGAGTGNAGAPPTATTLTGCGNVSYSHLAIYPRVLPPARIMAHFMAAYAAFGQLPAPSLACQFLTISIGGADPGPDGELYLGIPFFNAQGSGGSAASDRSVLTAYVTSAAGDLTSAVSQPESVNLFTDIGTGEAWLSATGLAPQYSFWTGNAGAAEQLAATTVQPYLYVTSYAPTDAPAIPATASALGDTVAARIERLLLSGGVTTPQRCIDAADLAVVAELDTGGQACGDNIGNVTASDDGLLHVDTCGNLCYWSRPHLATQPVRWSLGPFTQNGQIPYIGDVEFDTDPQRVFNDVAITQYDVFAVPAGQAGSATGSAETHGGLVFGPAAEYAQAVEASLEQFGDNQQQFTSYLQDTTQIQAQASWIFAQFGVPRQRITSLTVDAAGMAQSVPQAWEFVLSVNPGDLAQVTQWMPGQPPFTSVWRITQVKRKIDFAKLTAAATVVADWLPPDYWGVASQPDIEDEAGNDVSDQSGQVME